MVEDGLSACLSNGLSTGDGEWRLPLGERWFQRGVPQVGGGRVGVQAEEEDGPGCWGGWEGQAWSAGEPLEQTLAQGHSTWEQARGWRC